MKEILGGEGVEKAFLDLGIQAKCMYRSQNEHSLCAYEVWQLSDADFNKLSDIPDDDWKDNWGFWRYAPGANIDNQPVRNTIINGHEILARYDETRAVYPDLLTYFCEEWGASSPKNVCALAADMAQLNGMTMGELFSLLYNSEQTSI